MNIRILSGINQGVVREINALKSICDFAERISLKLELPYKLAATREIIDEKNYETHNVVNAWERERPMLKNQYTEFLCYDDNLLIGYIGICNFGGMPIEINGMVHPQYRMQGIFSMLFKLVEIEWYQIENQGMLLLSDKRSESGQGFVAAHFGNYSHTEYEMVLNPEMRPDLIKGNIILKLATNEDADEIAYQNSLYNFCELDEANLIKPEEEAKRGMYIYLAYYQHKIIGKVHTQLDQNSGGIFGLGVVPSYRHQGFGKIILHKAIDLLLEHRLSRIYLQVEANNKDALNLYLKTGFEVESAMDYYFFSRPRNM